MKFFSFTSGKVVDAFARQLAQDFFNACSKPGVAQGKDKTFEKKADQVLIAIYARAKAFRQEKRLGVINRARFAKSFQDELVRLGFAADLVSRVTTALVAAALSGN